jgi:hypothetical protein
LKHISGLVRKMPWWSYKPYPGHGPWSHLPPPLRPGWWYGRGWCWWIYPLPPYTPWLSKEDEIKYLEELKKYITEVVLKEIDKRLEELKSSK